MSDNWIAALSAEGRFFGALKSIDRGQAYSTTIPLGEDVSEMTFSATMHENPKAAALATFLVVTGPFADGVTPVTLSLSQATVAAFDADLDGDLDSVSEHFVELRENGARFAGATINILD